MYLDALVRMLVQEHKYRKITGDVLALGRQTVPQDPKTMRQFFKEMGVPVNPNLDESTFSNKQKTRYAGRLTDDDFMKYFSDDIRYKTMDVSTYEGADIIHDLNFPIPSELEGKFDFIVDGGTFDHLLDLKNAFVNVVKMLKPGGRVFQWNAASNYANAGYVSFSADFFFDYYVINKFSDVRCYFLEGEQYGSANWRITEFVPDGQTRYQSFMSSKCVMTIVLAEKGENSTYDRIPIQQQYRDAHLRQEYLDNMAVINQSKRPRLIGMERRRAAYREVGWL